MPIAKTPAPMLTDHAIVAAIARVFESALSAESEEDLGRACLAIAEELTGSALGFIGTLDARTGRLADIAVSDPGWDACRMSETAGHGKGAPGGFAIRGIYGRVLLDGKSVVTNDPASHPDRIGMPPGHPPLRAFLGVPLVHGRETWGMVAVGNREGGYGPAERAALEALAPAIMQAFMRKRAEDALRESEERYRQLFQNMLEGFAYCRMILDEAGRAADFLYLDVNGAFATLTGLHDVVGKRASEAIPGIWSTHPELLETYGRVARTGCAERFEIDFRPLGTCLSVSVYGAQPDHFVAVFDNITERKRAEQELRQSEQRLRALADSMPQLAWTARPDGFITWYNRRWYEYTGTTPEQMEGWGWQSVHAPATLPDVLRRWNESIATGTEFDMEFPLRGADGAFRRFLTRVIPLKNERGDVLQWFGTNTDVTELVEAQDALREADRRKDEFLGMLSHELRNPLAPIRNSIYVLQHVAPGSDPALRAQTVIQRQTEHLTRLVDDLLDVTRIARGKIELRPSRVDLREVVLRAADDFRLVMRDRGVRYEVRIPGGELWADADTTRITQIVGNLLHNSSKFTRRGDEVVLSLEADAREAILRVRDTGAGIEAALLPRIFEPFVQGERTMARTEGGLGLGLALVKAIAELHGGTVRAESAGAGKGAELTVRLPLVAALEAHPSPGSRPDRRSRGRSVLVVDDNVDAAESLADLVAMLGFSVEVAYDGRVALEKARARPPNVVLCDLGLPGMSGYEVAQALRAMAWDDDLQLVAVSGYAQPEDVKRALDAGFDAHVAKPCDPQDLERLLG